MVVPQLYPDKLLDLDHDLIKILEDSIADDPGIELIVIDTFGFVRGRSRPRENEYDRDVRELRRLKEFGIEHDVAMLVVHHNNKRKTFGEVPDYYDMISGTNGLGGTADNNIFF